MYACSSTGAYVPADRVHEGNTYQYTHGPDQVERSFTQRRGATIPEDYLRGVEAQLALAHQFMCAGHLFEYYSDVFYVKVFVSPTHRRIVFYGAQTRPCAEKRGFARIFLLQMCRSAVHLGYDLHIVEPSEESLPMLERAFGRQRLQAMPFEFPWANHFQRDSTARRLVITTDMAASAWERLTPRDSIQLVPYPAEMQEYDPAFTLPRIQLDPAEFPSAAILNAEPSVAAVKEEEQPGPRPIDEFQRRAAARRDVLRRMMAESVATANARYADSDSD